MKMKTKTRSHRFEAQFMKNLSNTEAELRKALLIKKVYNRTSKFKYISGI